jgi:hypothetical protein
MGFLFSLSNNQFNSNLNLNTATESETYKKRLD